MRKKTILTLLLPLVGAILLASCSAKSTPPTAVTTAAVRTAALTETVSIPGVLAPDRTANVYSSIPGNVQSIAVEVGNHVTAGQTLIRLDTRRLDAQLAAASAAVRSVQDRAQQAKLGIETAKANLDLARKSFDRVQALYKSHATSQNQFDDVQNKLQLAKNGYENAVSQYHLLSGSSLAQAKSQENVIRVQIDEGTITSPIDGVVTNRNVNQGEVVNPGVPLMTVADTSRLKLQGTVSQEAVSAIHLGQKAEIEIDGLPNTTLTGSVTQVGPVAASTGQYFPVVVTIANPGRLLAGMTATALLQVSGVPALTVPLAALKSIGGADYVYVVQSGTVRRRKVVTGLQNDTDVQVSGDLSNGTRVVTSNLDVLHDGMKVVIAQ